jgi:hypothetical protein
VQTLPASDWRSAEAPATDAPPQLCVTKGDFDGDGFSEHLQWLAGRIRVAGQAKAPQPESPPGTWFSGSARDLDGDGKDELLSHVGARVVRMRDVLKEPCTDTLVDLTAHLLPGTAIEAGAAGDWDRDGDVDLVLALPERGLVWLPNGGGAETPRFDVPVPLWPAAPGVRVCGLLLEDFDGDGWLDLFVTTCGRGSDGPFAFQHDEPRLDRTPAQDEELRRLERERGTIPRAGGELPTMPGTLHGGTVNPFERILQQKERADRIRNLRSIRTPWHARPVVVHVRRN